LVVGCWLLVVGCWLLVVGCWLLVVGCWLLVVGCWLLVVGCWLFKKYKTFMALTERLVLTACRLSFSGGTAKPK
ncbi:MAG: hypothetical protein ABJG36_14575, partial [Crocinitomicaceae bacterium]